MVVAVTIRVRCKALLAGALLPLSAMIVLAGCESSGNHSGRPAVQPVASVVTVVDPDEANLGAPSPDGYPTFAGSLSAANTQMSDEDAAALEQRLSALAASRKAGSISEAEYRRRLLELRRLAEGHGAEARSTIGN